MRFLADTRRTQCQLGYDGCTIESTQADHVVAHFIATALGWDPAGIDSTDNGQGVCEHCHSLKTARESALARRNTALQRPSRKRLARRHPGLKASNDE
ncbi:MAG: hypothetical protein ACR2QO_05910 [Acidimicrobiales bacterium]